MSRGQLHHILTNPIYAGRIRHKRQIFEGQHTAIIDPETWERLQQQLARTSARERNTKQHRDTSPLAGKILDGAGQKLTPGQAYRKPLECPLSVARKRQTQTDVVVVLINETADRLPLAPTLATRGNNGSIYRSKVCQRFEESRWLCAQSCASPSDF